MPKPTKSFVCSNCGFRTSKWFGQCPNCSEWNSLEEEATVLKENDIYTDESAKIYKLSEVNLKSIKRLPSGFEELNRVLGGVKNNTGFVPSSVVLLSGEPGIGKSTLLLSVLANVSEDQKVLYVSAEESEAQIALRAKRILPKSNFKNISILSSRNLDSILASIDKLKAKFVVIDSIQTIIDKNLKAVSGGIAQVKAVTLRLVEYAKKHDVTIVIVGHINKEGNIAGPKVLEHLVDTVLQMEGDDRNDYRLIRSLKNRFGPTNEVGILAMDENGLIDVKNAGSFFVTKMQASGVSRTATLEGSRIIVVEIQALSIKTSFVQPKRVAQGISNSRLQLICAILQKHTKLKIYDQDIYVNIAGGLRVNDPAIDLAIAYSIGSSIQNFKIKSDVAVVGELSLTGYIGKYTKSSLRKRELRRLGYKQIIDNTVYSHISRLFN